MRILDDLGGVVDRPDGDLGGLEEGDVLGLRPLRNEGADDGVERGSVLDAVGIAAEARIVDQVGPADGAEQPLGHLLDRGREPDISAVLAAVGVARRRIGRAAAGARLDLAGEPIVGGLRPEDREQRIEQRQIDHRPRPPRSASRKAIMAADAP